MTAPTRTSGHVLIAGVPWPAHKLVAVVVGLVVFAAVAALSGAIGPAVVSGWAVSTVVWLATSAFRPSGR